LQGLSDDYDLPDFNIAGKKKAVGNGVPLVIGRVLADAVKSATGRSHLNELDPSHLFDQGPSQKERCPCGCKRVLVGRKKYYDSSCRKRDRKEKKKTPSMSHTFKLWPSHIFVMQLRHIFII